jgi:hypothetical protein
VITPTIGRVILVRHRVGRISDQDEPALICHVWSDASINVGGFDANGIPFAIQKLELYQDDGAGPGNVHAAWMPYQKSQAIAASAQQPQDHAPSMTAQQASTPAANKTTVQQPTTGDTT